MAMISARIGEDLEGGRTREPAIQHFVLSTQYRVPDLPHSRRETGIRPGPPVLSKMERFEAKSRCRGGAAGFNRHGEIYQHLAKRVHRSGDLCRVRITAGRPDLCTRAWRARR